MSTVFTAGAKLLGVYFVYHGIVQLLTAATFSDGSLSPAAVVGLSGAVAVGLGLVLMFRTDALARSFGIGSPASTSLGGLDARAALHTGLVLIGVYVFLTRLGLALTSLSAALSGYGVGVPGGAPARLVVDAIPIALALLLVFRGERVADLIAQPRLRTE